MAKVTHRKTQSCEEGCGGIFATGSHPPPEEASKLGSQLIRELIIIRPSINSVPGLPGIIGVLSIFP